MIFVVRVCFFRGERHRKQKDTNSLWVVVKTKQMSLKCIDMSMDECDELSKRIPESYYSISEFIEMSRAGTMSKPFAIKILSPDSDPAERWKKFVNENFDNVPTLMDPLIKEFPDLFRGMLKVTHNSYCIVLAVDP